MSTHNKRFQCDCGEPLNKVINSRNRNGTSRVRTYECPACKARTSTVEMIVKEDLRSGSSGEAVFRREVLESVSAEELLEMLRFRLRDLGRERGGARDGRGRVV